MITRSFYYKFPGECGKWKSIFFPKSTSVWLHHV